MAAHNECEGCGRLDTVTGPEPYTCVVCGYIVTDIEEEE